MQEQMSGAAMAMPADTNKAFKVNSVLLSAEVIKASPSSVTHLSLVISGRVGGAGADWPSVGSGERRGGSDEQRAGLWRHVQQGAADWHLLTLRLESSSQILIIAGIGFWVRTTEVGHFPLCYAKFTVHSLMYDPWVFMQLHWFYLQVIHVRQPCFSMEIFWDICLFNC